MNVILKTERLTLRPVTIDDTEAIHQLHSIEEVDQYNTLGIPENIDVTILHVKDLVKSNQGENPRSYTFVMEMIEGNHFVGLIAINLGKPKYRNAEIWFKLHPDFWNKGIATEALREIISFGFNTLNLHRIEAGCAVDNIGSYKVLEKVGMIREAHTRQLLPLKSGWADNYGYAILSTDIR
ncbi:GNAT family N-acetyltransferase [Empedobacter falsenii]|uniref:GNAT family N-acetyltransferase n=1 Tax=Empedobacter falsenii TaxID=343874 RepID=UPI0025751303|nr:GNAT family N-acetyltransferase [Empedobacter falsenii]MDM1298747.1 GNAT family N-acetyltransferase [Empedobacter falsenii]MDM1318643.1 GNAT family N-acetyltransferase [Empedobacter falsenii]